MSSKYSEIRDKIRDGDLLLWRGNGLVARGIQTLGHQYHNHASFAFVFNKHYTKRVMLFEALVHGIEPEFLSARVNSYNGRCWWYQLDAKYEAYRPAIYQAANNYGGTGYDFKGLFKNIFSYVFVDVERLFCSEYVYAAGLDAGLPLEFGLIAPRPDDLLALGWWVKEGHEIIMPAKTETGYRYNCSNYRSKVNEDLNGDISTNIR